jgi:hypothetical protein
MSSSLLNPEHVFGILPSRLRTKALYVRYLSSVSCVLHVSLTSSWQHLIKNYVNSSLYSHKEVTHTYVYIIRIQFVVISVRWIWFWFPSNRYFMTHVTFLSILSFLSLLHHLLLLFFFSINNFFLSTNPYSSSYFVCSQFPSSILFQLSCFLCFIFSLSHPFLTPPSSTSAEF